MGGDGKSQSSGTDQNVEKSGYPDPVSKTAPHIQESDGADEHIGGGDHTVKITDN